MQGGLDVQPGNAAQSRKAAVNFVLVVAVASLFADMTHEAAHSTNGAFLTKLGASALAVAVISGLGEWCGYLVRLVSGSMSDRSRRYWRWTIGGHVVNMAAVPVLALVDSWQMAAVFIVLERIGKGLRNPPRDTMLSYAGTQTGEGHAFAIREAIDQIGAVTGPLMVALVLALTGSFHLAYALLLVPGVLCIVGLLVGRRFFPNPRSMEQGHEPAASAPAPARGYPVPFWLYLASMALVAFGYADFNLIAFHLVKTGHPASLMPVLYSIAMATAGTSAFLFGRLLDRAGLPILMVAVILSCGFAPLLFLSGGLLAIVVGIVLWGVGFGIQDSLMSAPVADMIHDPGRRGRAFGIFNATYGTGWFLGSCALGALLYTKSPDGLVVVSIVAQLLALPLLAFTGRLMRR